MDKNRKHLSTGQSGLKICLLLALTLLMAAPAALAQTSSKVTVSQKNRPISSICSEIEKQTGYTFMYSSSQIDVSRNASLVVTGAGIQEALASLFNGTGIKFEIKGRQIILSPDTAAAKPAAGGKEKVKVSGVVKDENGDPFGFVDVFVTGTTVGTLTDAQGRFELLVNKGDNLTVNFLGYESVQLATDKKTRFDVTMKPSTSMIEETVVVAFGEQKKSAMSSAISTVKADDIVKSPVSNISNAVTGRIPGLVSMQGSGQPGADEATLYIRGAGTWNNAEPLYVIDGVERNQAQFLRLEPSEIESFSILKDAAATAVYGSKAANGVIFVTTKRGEEGKPVINFNTSCTFSAPTRYPNYLNSYESLKLYNEALQNDGKEPIYSDDELQHYLIQDDPYRYPDVDWYDVMMKKFSTQTNNSISVRGGTKSVKYYLAGSYMYQDGQFHATKRAMFTPKFGYSRYTFRSNIDVLLTRDFTISIDMSGGMTDKQQPIENTSIFTYMNRIPSWVMPALNPDGSYAGTTDFATSNPLYMLDTRGRIVYKNNTINSSVRLSYDFNRFVKGLKASVRAAYDSNFGNYGQWAETVSTYKLVSDAGKADRYQRLVEAKTPTTSSGSISSTRRIYAEAILDWKRQLKEHVVSATAIANVADYRTTTEVPYKSVSFIGRANYSYKNRYFLEMNAAYRGSENFAPGHRFGLFPSISAGWNVHNERWVKDNMTFVDNLKLRASYGITGIDYANTRFIFKEGKWTTGTSAYAYFGPNVGASIGYSLEPSLANTLATWETAHQTNLGFDLSILKRKFTLSVDRFFENRSGILMSPNSIPGILGVSISDMNIGKTRKNGWEFDASFNQKINRNLTMYLKGNLTHIRNYVVDKDEPETTLSWQKEEGCAIGQQYGYVVLGYFRDQADIDASPVQKVGSTPIPGDFKYLDYNCDGVINEYDKVAIGYPKIPELIFGFSTGLTYKDFGLDVTFQGSAHSSVFLSQYLMYEFYNRGRVQDIHQGRWTPETADTATYPILHVGGTSQNHVLNTFFLKDNPYLRLKNVELSYNFHFAKNASVKGIRVHLSGVNLFTWDKLKVVDPETPTGSTGAIYPQTRGYSVGASFIF